MKNNSEYKQNGAGTAKIATSVLCCTVFGLGASAIQAQETQDTEDRVIVADEAPEPNLIEGGVQSGRIGFESADGDFSLRIGGRLLLDSAWYNSDMTDMGSGTKFRQARLSASGIIYRDWSYALQYDFTDTGEGGIKDAKIGYHALELAGNDVAVFAGNQFLPFGFQGQQSPKYTLFMEQPVPSLVLGAGARRLGARSDLFGSNWRLSVGVGQGILGARATAENEDDPVDMAAQFTINPIQESEHLLHLGASVRHHNANGADAFRLSARPQTHISGFRPVDTTGFEADGFSAAGLAAVYKAGPFSVESEYFYQKQDNVRTATVDGEDPEFTGAYLQAGYVLTGETRPFNPNAGVFGPINPESSLREGGIGAWQIVAGYSTIDLTDGSIEGGEMDMMMVGLNWYPERRIRVAMEYGNVLSVDGGPNDGDEPSFVQARFQVEW